MIGRIRRKPALVALCSAYGLMWTGGVVSQFVWGHRPSDTAWTSPLFLLLATAIVFQFADLHASLRLLAAGVIGFVAEAAGVHFGVPFGAYGYTSELGFSTLGVPVVIAGAWIILVAYSRALFGPHSVWLPAAWMTAIDLLIDPLAANSLGFWQWFEPGPYFGVPLLNFAGWFLVSALIFLLCRFRAPQQAGWLGVSVVAFFTAIAVAHRMWVPAGIGAVIASVSAVVVRAGIPQASSHKV